MGGKQKRLTKTRRAVLRKEMLAAFETGRLNLGGQPIDQVLDGIDEGIKNETYPIEVTLDGLLAIWSGVPAPEEAQTAAGAAPETAPAAEAAGHPAFSSAEQAVITLNSDGTRQTPYTGPDSTPHMQQIQAEADARLAKIGTAPTAEVGVPQVDEPEKPVEVDLAAVAEWYALAKKAEAKMDAAKDVYDHAKEQINNYLDELGGPDVSKSGKLDGKEVVKRTFTRRTNFRKDKLLADHPEIDPTVYVDETVYYKTTLK